MTQQAGHMAQEDCVIVAETGIGSPGLPFYTREQLARSPSIQQGMDPDSERRSRLQYTVFIQQVGQDLSVPQWAIYTAVYLCHHYYAKRSFQRSDKYLVAVACLYLGCKVQESPKYLRDVIRCAESRKWAKWCEEHPAERRKWEDMEHLERVRAEVLTAERAVLYTVCFQLRIQTPYTTVLALVKPLKDGQDENNVTQIAWSLVNDSLKTHLSLMYPPEQLGAAGVYFAYVTLGLEPQTPDGRTFCEFACTPAHVLEEILETLLSLYNTALLPQSNPAAPPQQQGVKQEVFRPAGGPGVHIQHNRLMLVSQQDGQQQEAAGAMQPEPTSPAGQGMQQKMRSLTASPAPPGQQQQQQQQQPVAVKTERVASGEA